MKTRILFLMVFVVVAVLLPVAQAMVVDNMTQGAILRPPTETGRWADERGAGALKSSAFSCDCPLCVYDGSMMIDYSYWATGEDFPPGDPYDRVPRGYFEVNPDHPEYAPALPDLTGLSFEFCWWKGNAAGPEHVRELQIYSPSGMARFHVANGGEGIVGAPSYNGMQAGWQCVTTAPVGSAGWTYEGDFDATSVTTIDFWVSCWSDNGIGWWQPDPPDGPWEPMPGYEQYYPTGTPIYIDCLELVPEPATMSLLGLGALALLKRRKA
jgi:hypothetical protein